MAVSFCAANSVVREDRSGTQSTGVAVRTVPHESCLTPQHTAR